MRDFATSDDPEVQAQLDRLAALSLPEGRFGLETIRELLARLGDPHTRIPPAFHVAGTNGKGSVCAYLRAMLEADGLTVHATISPHLVRYNERIRIAGKLVEDTDLAALLNEVLDAAEGLAVSFFEATIAASFLVFSRNPADACVIETGLGGRFDATSMLTEPAACGIAALGIDHERFLLAPEAGAPEQPLARIAFEKAGIIKPGSPVSTLSYTPEAEFEIERAAAAAGAPLHMRGKDWDASLGTLIDYRDRHGALTLPLPSLPGAHQADNAALAVAMLRHQDAVTVSPEAMARGIRSARWPARLQWLGEGPLTRRLPHLDWLLDGGHNPDAARVLADFIATRRQSASGEVHAVVGMIAGKDWGNFLDTLCPQLASLTVIPVPGHDSVEPMDLLGRAMENGVGTVGRAGDLDTALRQIGTFARSESTSRDTLLIAGSLYLAGEVLRANDEIPD